MKFCRTHPGFTLIEIMIVITIMGLLTTAAVLSFARPLRTAQAHEAIEMLRAADADARRAAVSFDRSVTLAIDFGTGAIERRELGRGMTFHAALPGAVRIDRVRIGPKQVGFEDVSLVYSPLGLSQTFALRITTPDDDAPRWLVFAGLGGQMSVITDDSKVEQILAQSR